MRRPHGHERPVPEGPPPAPEGVGGAPAAPGVGPEVDPRERRRTELGLLLMVVLWAVNFSVVKVALERMDPLGFNALRFPLASLALWLILRHRGPIRLPPRRDVAKIVALGVVGNVVYQLLFILGIDRTLAGNAALLLAATPVWTALLSRIFGGERHPARVWLGVGGTLAGLALVVAGSGASMGLDSRTLAGDLMLGAGSIAWAIYTVGAKTPIARHGSMAVTAWTLWVGTAFLLFLGLPDLARQDWSILGPGFWAAVLFSGVGSIALAYLFWYQGVRVLGGTRTAAHSNLVPVVALVVAWLWLGEVPGGIQLVGAAVTIGGVSLARR